MKLPITGAELATEYGPNNRGTITFNLMAWPAPIKAELTGITHSEVAHRGVGFCRIVYAKGVQYIAIYQQLCPIDGQTDMGLVVIADLQGNIHYQAIERGADYQFTSHHLPAFLFLQNVKGAEVKAGQVTVYSNELGTYSIDARCNRVWIRDREATTQTQSLNVTGAMWAGLDGAYYVQDYYQGRLLNQVRFGQVAGAIYHLDNGATLNPNYIAPMPYAMRDIQNDYVAAWMKRERLKYANKIPTVILEGSRNVLLYDDGTKFYDSHIITPDGKVKAPVSLFVYDKIAGAWVDGPERKAEIARQLAKTRGAQDLLLTAI